MINMVFKLMLLLIGAGILLHSGIVLVDLVGSVWWGLKKLFSR